MSELITILGPTATGKTKLATLLAHRIGGEIISADSRQVYRGMDIGTGKDLDDFVLDGKTIPYHLINIANPGDEYNVFSFQSDFLKAYRSILAKNRQPILCGGTGLYLEAALSGYRFRQVPKNFQLRKKLESLSHQTLITMLKRYGALHNTTDITQRERTIRAIEIRQYQQDFPEENPFPKINSLNIGLRFERNIVRQRITQRLKQRLENGLIEEVQRLIASGLNPEQLTFYGLEYRYVTQYVTGEIDYQTLFDKLNIAIHQFSKRQATWFRKMEKQGIVIHWIEGSLSEKEKVNLCMNLIRKNQKKSEW